MLGATKELLVAQKAGSFHEAKQLFWEDQSKGVLIIPEDFEKNLFRGYKTSISIYCDASYFLLYKETLTGTIQSVGTLSAGVEIKRLLASGDNEEQAMQKRDPMPSAFYNLYNPAGSYGSYLMPGLILIILQQTLLIGIGMVGGARKEKGNNKEINLGNSKSQNFISIVFGKSLAYFLLSLANLAFTLVYLPKLFGFPDKGQFADICILLVPYLFSIIFLGLAISMIFRRREHSIMTMVFISPIVLFISGLSWPSTSIPPLLYQLAHVFPSTSMIPAFLRIRTMGVSLINVREELLFLSGQMILYLLLAAACYRISTFRQQIKNMHT
jgi:ABC-2 type transport system permease protein